MKKTVNIRNIIIVMLCITIIFMGIGFAYLSVILTEKNNEKPILDVSIVRIEEETPIKGGLVAPVGVRELKNDKKTINFNFIMYTPQDELAYKIVVKNTGTLPAKIEDVLTYPNYLEDEKARQMIQPISINHNDISDKIIEPEEELEIKLVTSYANTGQNVGQVSINYQMTILATSTNK